jgi:hypothetical protein
MIHYELVRDLFVMQNDWVESFNVILGICCAVARLKRKKPIIERHVCAQEIYIASGVKPLKFFGDIPRRMQGR